MTISIEQAQARVTERVLPLPGVSGTALGLKHGKPCIKVYVSGEATKIRKKIPATESGYPVVVEVSGAFGAL